MPTPDQPSEQAVVPEINFRDADVTAQLFTVSGGGLFKRRLVPEMSDYAIVNRRWIGSLMSQHHDGK
jgi:hypothetical protein